MATAAGLPHCSPLPAAATTRLARVITPNSLLTMRFSVRTILVAAAIMLLCAATMPLLTQAQVSTISGPNSHGQHSTVTVDASTILTQVDAR